MCNKASRIVSVLLLSLLLFSCTPQISHKDDDYWQGSSETTTDPDISETTSFSTQDLTNADLPEYWTTHLREKADEICEVMESVGKNKSSFFFYNDAHWETEERTHVKIVPRLLKSLYQYTPIQKTNFGGDIIADESSRREDMEYLWVWRSMLSGLPNHHSVVGNHDDGNTTDRLFSSDYIYAYLFAPEESSDMNCGDGFYYYIDNAPEKTRYLYLDTAYKGLDNEQQEFIINALQTTQNGWHIVVISHIWYEPDYNQYDITPIPIKGFSEDALKIADLLDAYNARSGAFTDCGGTVEFCIGGHTHIDYDGRTPGGIPIILTESANRNSRSGLNHDQGTINETAISAIIADYDSNRITVIRIGRGMNRVITSAGTLYEDGSGILKDALPKDAVNILDTSGFTENLRLKYSNGNTQDHLGTDVTGYIPVNEGDILYLRNVIMPNTENDYKNVVAYYSTDHTYITAHSYTDTTPLTEFDADENVIKFQIPEGAFDDTSSKDSGFIRICAVNIDMYSIITVNTPLS